MKVRNLIVWVLTLSLLAPMSINAQQNEIADDEMIEFLHNKGILLVRLQTNKPKINALEKDGKKEEAKKVEEETKQFNERMIQAFEKHYKFTPVYFFYSDNSLDIKNLDFTRVFNSEGKEIYENPNYFLVVDYGKTSNMGIEGLIVKNENFEQLSPPFPYLVRRFTAFGMKKRTLPEMVMKLNSNFFKFFEKADIPAEHRLQQDPVPENP